MQSEAMDMIHAFPAIVKSIADDLSVISNCVLISRDSTGCAVIAERFSFQTFNLP